MFTGSALILGSGPDPKTGHHETLNQLVSPGQGAITQASIRIWALPCPLNQLLGTWVCCMQSRLSFFNHLAFGCIVSYCVMMLADCERHGDGEFSPVEGD